MIIRTMEEERERLLDRARRNEAAALANARREAREEAEHRNSLEIAKKMKTHGADVDTIATCTALTIDEVQKL